LISKPWILGNRQIIFQRHFGQKYFVQNGRRQEWTRDFDPPFFGHFFGHLKMSILPFARGSFENMKCKHPKIGFVTIMLTKHVFGVEKL
jgi:hypothetical protein